MKTTRPADQRREARRQNRLDRKAVGKCSQCGGRVMGSDVHFADLQTAKHGYKSAVVCAKCRDEQAKIQRDQYNLGK